ncbi:MAG: CvpA family protein [Planctomycetota bacterium]|nr:CvpA family protein [Planctomycetota bacterium]
MILNLVVIAIVLGIAYMWAAQGVFSALLHLVCTIAAGAIAFGVWEILVDTLLLGVRQDIAWGVGLVAPFAVSLLLLRLAADKLIPANMDFDGATNFVGGAIFGLGSGVITAGILLIAVGFMSMPASLMGFQRLAYEPSGNIAARDSLWLPADRITAGLYETLSTAGFATSTPLAIHQPDVHEQAQLVRLTFDDKSRTTLSPNDFDVIGHYEVAADSPNALTMDSFSVTEDGEGIPQQVRTIDGEQYPAGSTLHGYVITFKAGAREKSGQVVIGPAQVRLIYRIGDEADAAHPFAVVSQADGSGAAAARFRFADPAPAIASPSAASQVTMAFEFLLPPGAEPVDLLVKNARARLGGVPAVAGSAEGPLTVAARDEAVRTMSLLGMQGRAGDIDTSGAVQVAGGDVRAVRDRGIEISNAVSRSFNRQSRGGLEVSAENEITGGRHKFDRGAMSSDVPRQLRVERFGVPSGVQLVQVDVSLQSKLSILGKSVQMAQEVVPPVLIDSNGQQYQAIGYVYQDSEVYEIRYTPEQPIRGLREIPELSRNKPDQSLELLFFVNNGVNVTTFALGNAAVAEFDPAVEMPSPRQRP